MSKMYFVSSHYNGWYDRWAKEIVELCMMPDHCGQLPLLISYQHCLSFIPLQHFLEQYK